MVRIKTKCGLQNTSNAVFAYMAIAALLAMPMSVSMSEAVQAPTYDPTMVEHIRAVTSQTGTTTIVEDT